MKSSSLSSKLLSDSYYRKELSVYDEQRTDDIPTTLLFDLQLTTAIDRCFRCVLTFFSTSCTLPAPTPTITCSMTSPLLPVGYSNVVT